MSMKRFNPKLAVALAAIAVMSVGVVGARSVAFAQNPTPPVTSASPAVTDTEKVDGAGQVGQQDAPGAPEVKDANEPIEQPGAPEVQDANEKPNTGEQAGTETNDTAESKGDETADAAALAGKAKITAQQAEAAALAANPGTAVKKTDLGDENGTIVYDVELSNGSDVKVDAQSGAVIGTDAQDANEKETGEQSNN